MILRFVLITSEEGFDALTDLISSFPLIEHTCHFVFIPGPQDLCPSTMLPQRPIFRSFTQRLERLPKVHFCSNPCRIKFFGQEIVIFREDMMARILRNLINVKPETDAEVLKRFVHIFYSFFSVRFINNRVVGPNYC